MSGLFCTLELVTNSCTYAFKCFSSSEELEKANQALTNAGLKDIHIRRVNRFGKTNDSTQDTISSAVSFSGLVLHSGDSSILENSSERILLGADPSVSGFSTSNNELPSMVHCLTVFAPVERVEETVTIIKQNGGDT